MTSQAWNPDRYLSNAGFVPELGRPVLALLDPQPGETILDLGCGDGSLTVALVAAGATVVAVDGSPDMVAAARARGLDARVADGQALDLPERFDAVFSNAALHWMAADPAAVVRGVARHLKPGGRFVAEMGGFGNVAAIVTALVAALDRRGIDGAARVPWVFPTEEHYGALLAEAGLQVERTEILHRQPALPQGMAGWLDTFADPFLHGLTAQEGRAVKDEACRLLAPALRDRSGRWAADYVRLRFVARRPGATAG